MLESTLNISNSHDIITRAAHIYSALRLNRPRTKADLKNYVKVFLGIDVPSKSICANHAAPMDYLAHSFFSDFTADLTRDTPIPVAGPSWPCLPSRQVGRSPCHGKVRKLNADAAVWANRGGGKTELAAVATLLDCIFKPNCQVRILGGSLEQSNRMYDYLLEFLSKGFCGLVKGKVRKEKCGFVNDSSVEVLTQSATSVRGCHIQKLRCDEVELFDEQVFAAAQFVTQSTDSITAAMEVISTMHRPFGLMHKVISSAEQRDVPIFKWCVWEVIERCIDRTCSQCPLWSDCGGRAKNADGYLKIDDCITQMQRSSRAGWEAEMLCQRPSLENLVFSEFDPAVHVKSIDYDPNLPLYRSLDFGFVNPFVCLWIQVDGDGFVRVIDEYVRSRASIDVHAAVMKERTPVSEEKVTATFCDPAGAGRSDVTGTSTTSELRALGIRTRYRRSGILEGIELIRRALRDGQGRTKLAISPACPRLIEALSCYHYPDIASNAERELPLKDGLYDHPIDALRYFFVNHTRRAKPAIRRY